MRRFCLSMLLLGACLRAQNSVDPLLAQLNSALSSKDQVALRSSEQKLLSAQQPLSTLLAAGVLLAQNDKLHDASVLFDRCANLYPASFEAKYNLALARIGLSDYSEALTALGSVSPVTAEQKAAVEYLTGKIFLATNHLSEAQKKLASAYAQRPDEENYALDLGLLYIRSAAYLPAIEVLEHSQSVHPDSQELQVELALADALAGRYAEGLALCRRLQQDDPALSIPRLIAAFSYCSEKDYQACEAESSAGLRFPDANPYLYYLHASALWGAGSSSRAQMLEDVSKAIQQMPECSVCLLLRSRMFEAAHDDSAAIGDLKRALQENSQSASAWYRLSLLYRKTGQLTQASNALDHYRSIHTDETIQELESFREQFLAGAPSPK